MHDSEHHPEDPAQEHSGAQLEALVSAWIQEQTSCLGTASSDRLEELHDHLMCAAEERVGQGVEPEEAVRLAVAQFGSSQQIKQQLGLERTAFRRWLWSCRSGTNCAQPGRPQSPERDQHLVGVSLLFAATLLVTAWLSRDARTYALVSTTLIGLWVVLAARQGGTREAARAEWRWLKRKFGR